MEPNTNRFYGLHRVKVSTDVKVSLPELGRFPI